jgi:hypothetical protein
MCQLFSGRDSCIKTEALLQAFRFVRAPTASGKGCGNAVTKSLHVPFFLCFASPRRRRGGNARSAQSLGERGILLVLSSEYRVLSFEA